MQQLSEEERKILGEYYSKGCAYITRDENGTLSIHEDFPEKYYNVYSGIWVSSEYIDYINPDLFQFIKWEDDKPYEIEKLLKESEK